MSAIIKGYILLIREGKITLQDVPEQRRNMVLAALSETGADYGEI